MLSIRSAALALTVLVAQAPLRAAPPSTRHRWDISPFSWVQLSPAEQGAPANHHPLRVSTASLEQALTHARLVTPKDEAPLFGGGEVAELAKVLFEAFNVAAPGEDVELVSTSKRLGSAMDSALTVTARLFLLDGKLNLLVHDARLDFVYAYNMNFQMPKFEFGSRTKPSSVVLKTHDGEARRADWLVLPLAATTPATAPPAVPATPAPAATVGLEERLLRLKRLREQNLINEEDYAKRKQELLKEI